MPEFAWVTPKPQPFERHDPEGEYATKGPVQKQYLDDAIETRTPSRMKPIDKYTTPDDVERARSAEKVRRGPASKKNLSERLM